MRDIKGVLIDLEGVVHQRGAAIQVRSKPFPGSGTSISISGLSRTPRGFPPAYRRRA